MPVGPRGLAGNGLALRTSSEGRYELQVIGADHAAYKYVVQAWDRTGRPRWTHFARGATEPGAVDRYELTYSLSLTPPIWIAEKRDHSLLTVFLDGVRQGRSESTDVGELVLTDPRGSRLGVSPLTKATYKEIPRAYYGAASNEGSELGVPEPADGVYTLDVVQRPRSSRGPLRNHRTPRSLRRTSGLGKIAPSGETIAGCLPVRMCRRGAVSCASAL